MLSNDFIQNLSIFKTLQACTLSAIARTSKIYYYKRGTVFYDTHNNCTSPNFYYIVKGWVKLYSVSLEGTEIIKDILTDAQYFNEELLLEAEIEQFRVQAITDIQVMMLPVALLKRLLQRDSQLAINLLKKSLQKQRKLVHEVEHLSIQSAAQRIGCFLLRLCTNNYLSNITLQLPYDKSLVAAKLGMCPETFSRALAKLSKQCQIKVNGEMVYIPHVNNLARYVCKQCSLIYPCQKQLSITM